ncbi:MAG: gliding motility-associated C-terminal domain-containing protein [Cytophagales bacterium]|nr:gliding motility-associated C-terminal domain-containing protein [Cytophaga sp.]
MKKYIILILILLLSICIQSYGQSKRANVWYLSQEVGLNFNFNPPCVIESGVLETNKSSSSICDKNGNLQFYSNNETIWNSNNQIISNGTNLYACSGSAQGSVVVPLTSNPYQYYLVTCDNFRDPPGVYATGSICRDIYAIKNILCLNLIDMGADNGKGTVLFKNKVIYAGYVNGMIGATKHINTKDTWLLTYDYDINKFVSLLLTDCGIQDTVISNIPFNVFDPIVPVKFSPKGDLFHIKEDYPDQGAMIAHFNTTTGEASAPIFIKSPTTEACFSIDNRYLYTSPFEDNIPRHDLSLIDTASINASKQVTPGYLVDGRNSGIQNGPDGKVYYVFCSTYLTWYIIDDPLSGTMTARKSYIPITKNYDPIQFTTPPNFVQSWFDPNFVEYEYGSPIISYDRVCAGNKSTFKAAHIPPATNYHWEIFENNLPVTYYYNQDSITHLFSSSGKYTVKLSIDFSCIPDIITRSDIFVDAFPSADYIKDTILCTNNNFVLQAEPNQVSYLWNTGNTTAQQVSAADNVYAVSVTNTCGTAVDSVKINKVTYRLYNLITPNHDALNETFKIDSNADILGNLVIYNSWGARIYENNSYNSTWPEKDIDAGVYYYEFTYSTCNTDKGWVQVIK